MSVQKRIVLTVALVLSSSSLALAQGFDPNLGNRIPVLNEPGVYGYRAGNETAGTTWLLPPRPTETMDTAPVGLYGRPYGALRSAPVGLYGGPYRRALRSAQVGLYQQPVSATDPGYDGPYREDALAAGIANLYGRSGGSYQSYGYQSAPVGLYGRPYGGFRSARVGLYRGGYGAGRIYRRPYAAFRSGYGYGGFRSAPVGLYGGGYGGYGGFQSAPVGLYRGSPVSAFYSDNPMGPTRFDHASSPFAGGGM